MTTSTLNKPINRINKAEAFKLRYKNGLTFQEIGERYGVTKEAAFQSIQSLARHLPDAEDVEAYRQNKAIILEGVEQVLVGNLLNPTKLKEASLNNVGYTFQQVANQLRLEKGLATERIDSVSITASLSELDKRKTELLRTIRIQDVVHDTNSSKT